MKLTLDALQVIDAIDRHGSFAAAGDALFRVPSAITYSVRKLEEDLGIRVFDRSGRRAELTAAGRELLAQGRHLLSAAAALETRACRAADGWEAELRIAVDDLIPLELLWPIVAAFDASGSDTRLSFSREVMGGTWDAVVDGRADLAVGAPGDAPSGVTLSTAELGAMEFRFAVAPSHPLADAPEPIGVDVLRQYRAVVVSDTSRSLPGRSSGFMPEQPVLRVPSLRAKVDAQIAGLGIGFVPMCLLREPLQRGVLLARDVAIGNDSHPLHLAWQPDHAGRALAWFVDQLSHCEALHAFLHTDH